MFFIEKFLDIRYFFAVPRFCGVATGDAHKHTTHISCVSVPDITPYVTVTCPSFTLTDCYNITCINKIILPGNISKAIPYLHTVSFKVILSYLFLDAATAYSQVGFNKADCLLFSGLLP